MYRKPFQILKTSIFNVFSTGANIANIIHALRTALGSQGIEVTYSHNLFPRRGLRLQRFMLYKKLQRTFR